MILKTLLFTFLLLACFNSQKVSEVDFVLGSVSTGSFLWRNFVGLSFQQDNIRNLMNRTDFQGYILNANVKGSWSNNWISSIKTKVGYRYNCAGLTAGITNPNITCSFDTYGNADYWSVLGDFVWNTQSQPRWSLGYSLQGVDLNLPAHREVYNNWVYEVYKASYNVVFFSELVDYGDKMVQMGYKTSYTPTDFLNDMSKAILASSTPVYHIGPGITQDASDQWLMSIEKFSTIVTRGFFSVRCIVFQDPSKLTIQSMLSDNATKYYLRQRFTINQTYAYSDFSKMKMQITDIRLTTGEGIDGVTNTFASALWALDMSIEFMLMNGAYIHFNCEIRNGNFQSVFGPDLKPSPIYYGLLFAVLARDNTPQIIIPSTKAVLSSKIKAFGLQDKNKFKVLLINKDTNASLNGTVFIKSDARAPMKCFYLEAPSLDSKDGITIGGYNFISGNPEAQGNFVYKKVLYSENDLGYNIPIKYAQAVLCEGESSKFIWPKLSWNHGDKMLWNLSLIVMLLFFIWSY